MTIEKHPIYDYEFCSETGHYRRVGSIAWYGYPGYNLNKYLTCSMRAKGDKKSKTMSLHQALWEAHHGPIPSGHEIDHIDNDRTNNKLSNLQCITISENRKRRNHDFLIEVRQKIKDNMKNIKSIDIETGETHVFRSKSNCSKYFGCSPARIFFLCNDDNINNTFKNKYRFEYTEDEVDTVVDNPRIARTTKKPPKTEEEKKKARSIAMKKYNAKKKAVKEEGPNNIA